MRFERPDYLSHLSRCQSHQNGNSETNSTMTAEPLPTSRRKRRVILASVFIVVGLAVLVIFASQSQPAGPVMQGIIQNVNPDGSLTLKMYGTTASGKPYWCGDVETYKIQNSWKEDWRSYPAGHSTVIFQLRSTWFGLFTAYDARMAGYPMDVDTGSGGWSISIPCTV